VPLAWLRSRTACILVGSLMAVGCMGSETLHGADDAGSSPGSPTAPTSTEPGRFIVVDQFGYRPEAEKVAVIRDPQTGFDAGDSFTPGTTYALVEIRSGTRVFTGSPKPWSNGSTDASSGDRAWWFDFSSVTTPGSYYVLDTQQNVRSFEFRIAQDVYRVVLKHALRTFFYQRAGQIKEARFAGQGWADGASHLGPLQDRNCRLYSDPGNAATERDLSGGWYDAGDYNKYTNWHAGYVVSLLRAYEQRRGPWTDTLEIPESGNGTPDVIDEARWGMDWLARMQNVDGSVLSIVGLSHASPPSAAAGASLHGLASASATLSAAAAFAYGSKVFRALDTPEAVSYADGLRDRAVSAYAWAVAHPSVLFRNNDAAAGTSGLGAGQQETDDYGRLHKRIDAAVYLFEVTGDTTYRDFVDAHYSELHLIASSMAYPFELGPQETLLYYASLPNATATVAERIRSAYRSAILGADNLDAHRREIDPYLAYMKDYVWGSNSTKANQGLMFLDVILQGVDTSLEGEARKAAERYLHYLHGVNPLQMVYLSNMSSYGADKGVNEFYHSWFVDGSALWDRVGTSTYGPAPGFLTGGPNPQYDWDGCCPSGCGSATNNARCGMARPSPPYGQPAQKSYLDFNTSWPLNSWSVTENSNGYQVAYIRLLSHFVD
jgi:endoglucanase